ncbi:hypothetical protein SLEP1_g8565 [Rubroshorea leprosula]|uniref:Uncharacterized protein n=1 Tax=Rubroshorea leprosula TaxID=152421 RepID=A0AAV5ID63_9ROSI|nr:hypothetical protein SLEP1_g8565 [Rubroshorea leprosula]
MDLSKLYKGHYLCASRITCYMQMYLYGAFKWLFLNGSYVSAEQRR